MANNTQSPKPKSQSPSRPSAFQWPVPNSSYDSNISVREIIEKYYPNDHELLKHALMAKAEEDRVRILFVFIVVGIHKKNGKVDLFSIYF